MTLNAQNLVAWHDRTTADHVAQRDKFADLGFRPLSLSIYGSPSDPRYAAVMVKRPTVIATHSFVGLSQASYQKTFDDMAKQGFGPFIITATGPGNGAVFAGSFRQMAHIPLTRSNLTKDQFVQMTKDQHAAGAILMWADAFGTDGDPRYCAIWAPNPERIAWNIDAVDGGGGVLQQRFLHILLERRVDRRHRGCTGGPEHAREMVLLRREDRREAGLATFARCRDADRPQAGLCLLVELGLVVAAGHAGARHPAGTGRSPRGAVR